MFLLIRAGYVEPDNKMIAQNEDNPEVIATGWLRVLASISFLINSKIMKAHLSIAADSRRVCHSGPSILCLRIVLLSVLVFLSGGEPAFAASMQQTVADSAGIVRDFTRIPEHAIPPRVLRNARGVAILRVLKGGFGVSGRLGEGVVIARLSGRGWSGPSAIATGGGGFGFQIGGNVTEFVIILNSQAAVDAFAHGGNVQFGGALSIAAGPVGRTAEAGVLPVAAVYTYSRSQGLFAGVSLEGTILVAESNKNARYYRRSVTPEQILRGRVPPPPSAQPLIAALGRY
jgi:lipid-binding SYLF domain-containing protein